MDNVEAGGVCLQNGCVGIAGTEGIDAVEGILRAAIPEVAIVKDRVNHRRSISRRRLPHIHRSARRIEDAKNRIGHRSFIFRTEPQNHVIKIIEKDALRSHNVVVVRKNRGVGTSNVSQLVQRKITGGELMVWTKTGMKYGG